MFHAAPHTLPALPGAYVLAVRLDAPLDMAAGNGVRGILAPGRYLYCGSAKSPGGLRARLGRHMRKGKRPRWHIDRLTEAGTVLGAWVFTDVEECALVRRLDGFPHPLPGFGASDCRDCPSHLLAWPADTPLPPAFGPWPAG